VAKNSILSKSAGGVGNVGFVVDNPSFLIIRGQRNKSAKRNEQPAKRGYFARGANPPNAMITANPLHGVVFEYLLEDVVIARELLPVVLDEEVHSLELRPQGTSSETGGGISTLRFDFKAIPQKKDGSQNEVPIELQKRLES